MHDAVRWGVAGPGGIAARFGDAMELVGSGAIVAVASRSSERAEAYGARYGVDRCFDDYQALADDPGVDAVYVATPHARHESDTLAYLEAGKHVLCEKPFALNQRQARRMVAAARERGVFLMEAMWSRFLPAYRLLLDVMAAGRIGTPLVVEGDFGFPVPMKSDHRLYDPGLGGGALLDLGIYPVQLCSLVFGPPERIVAEGVVGSTGVDEQVAAVLTYRGGGLGVVKASLRAALGCRARISGSDGAIDLSAMMHDPPRLTVNGERTDTSYEGDGLRFQIEEVHRCLNDGMTQSPTMPWEETVTLAGTLDAIRAQLGVTYPGDAAD